MAIYDVDRAQINKRLEARAAPLSERIDPKSMRYRGKDHEHVIHRLNETLGVMNGMLDSYASGGADEGRMERLGRAIDTLEEFRRKQVSLYQKSGGRNHRLCAGYADSDNEFSPGEFLDGVSKRSRRRLAKNTLRNGFDPPIERGLLDRVFASIF